MKRTLLATALALCVAQIAHGKIVDDKKALEIITDGRLIYSQGFKEPSNIRDQFGSHHLYEYRGDLFWCRALFVNLDKSDKKAFVSYDCWDDEFVM